MGLKVYGMENPKEPEEKPKYDIPTIASLTAAHVRRALEKEKIPQADIKTTLRVIETTTSALAMPEKPPEETIAEMEKMVKLTERQKEAVREAAGLAVYVPKDARKSVAFTRGNFTHVKKYLEML